MTEIIQIYADGYDSKIGKVIRCRPAVSNETIFSD